MNEKLMPQIRVKTDVFFKSMAFFYTLCAEMIDIEGKTTVTLDYDPDKPNVMITVDNEKQRKKFLLDKTDAAAFRQV